MPAVRRDGAEADEIQSGQPKSAHRFEIQSGQPKSAQRFEIEPKLSKYAQSSEKFAVKKIFLVSMIVLGGCASAPAERVVTRTVTVTRTSYVSLAPELLPQVDAPANAASVATNGEMFRAWQHDAGQLGICKPAMDAIRRLQPNENR